MRVACLAIGFLWAASTGAEVLYRLPWADGLSFMFTQVSDGRITSHFTKATRHAVDIAMPEGIPIVAARGGGVEAVEARYGVSPEEEPLTYEGNFVLVRHADGTAASYAHLRYRGVAVAAGETVEAGRLLGYSGATGDVEEPHLHFAVTRTEKNSSGWREDVSVPVKFYVGVPPVAFAPRAALRVTATYSGIADMPRAPSEQRLLSWKRPTLEPGEEGTAWRLLALWLACGAAGLVWFWKFAKE
ncbi:MAG TPA: M23 family metallopeptidase [Burkholderiales bacterium]|nr:M23 family metallopeptidase [Burkholderiales bacterium]